MCSPLASLLPTQGGKQKEVEPNGCGSKLKSQGKPQVCVGFHLQRCHSGKEPQLNLAGKDSGRFQRPG